MLLFASCHFKQSYPVLFYRNRSLSVLQIQARQERLLRLSINREQRTQGAGFELLPTHLYAGAHSTQVPLNKLSSGKLGHSSRSPCENAATTKTTQGRSIVLYIQGDLQGRIEKSKVEEEKSKTKYHFSVKLYRKWSRLRRVHTNQGSNQAT